MAVATIAHVPSEVLVQIFKNLHVEDVHRARQVCPVWNKSIIGNDGELWKAQCEALELIPDGESTVLEECAKKCAFQVDGDEHNDVEVAQVYRTHYLTWMMHICTTCNPFTRTSLEGCDKCTPPGTFRWIDKGWVDLFQVSAAHGVPVEPSMESVRRVRIGDKEVYRLDDFLVWITQRWDVYVARRIERNLVDNNHVQR